MFASLFTVFVCFMFVYFPFFRFFNLWCLDMKLRIKANCGSLVTMAIIVQDSTKRVYVEHPSPSFLECSQLSPNWPMSCEHQVLLRSFRVAAGWWPWRCLTSRQKFDSLAPGLAFLSGTIRDLTPPRNGCGLHSTKGNVIGNVIFGKPTWQWKTLSNIPWCSANPKMVGFPGKTGQILHEFGRLLQALVSAVQSCRWNWQKTLWLYQGEAVTATWLFQNQNHQKNSRIWFFKIKLQTT